jgi:hypothetical protein
MALLYFSPDDISTDKLLGALNYLSTIIFPLLYIGNEQSVRRPRRASGLQLDDVIELVWMAVNLSIVSVPSYVILWMLHLDGLCPMYGLMTAIVWYRYSIRKTARQIEKEGARICSNL